MTANSLYAHIGLNTHVHLQEQICSSSYDHIYSFGYFEEAHTLKFLFPDFPFTLIQFQSSTDQLLTYKVTTHFSVLSSSVELKFGAPKIHFSLNSVF